MATATIASKLPETKPYRVAQAGVIYYKVKVRTGLDGEDETIATPVLGTFGEEVQLTEREVNRLAQVGLDYAASMGLKEPVEYVKPKDAPLSYDEMDDKQLDKLIKDRDLTVHSSGADDEQPLRTDKINALLTFDQGRGVTA